MHTCCVKTELFFFQAGLNKRDVKKLLTAFFILVDLGHLDCSAPFWDGSTQEFLTPDKRPTEKFARSTRFLIYGQEQDKEH